MTNEKVTLPLLPLKSGVILPGMAFTMALESNESRVAVEAASPRGWERYAGVDGAILAMYRFGASAPIKDILKAFGFTPEHIVEAAKAQIEKWKQS